MEKNFDARQLYEQLSRLFRHYRTYYNVPVEMPGMHKINSIEQQLLNLLEWQNSIGIKTVVNELGLPNSTVTSAVSRLIKKELIIKEIDRKDRRAFVLKLTNRGKDLVAYSRYLKMGFAKELLDGLDTEEEGQKFIELLSKTVLSLDHRHNDQTRSDVMNSLQKEYHNFGPWLIEIKTEEEIPQQYLSHSDKIMAADYSFKVPVKVDRHRLRPGMLMYNTLVCIYPDNILLLKASADSLIDYTIGFDEIIYVASSRELLDSHMVLGTDQKTFDIDYNSVSNEISTHVMGLLRKRIFKPCEKVDAGISLSDDDVPEEIYKTMTNMIKEEEGLSVLGYQPKVKVTRHYTNATETILNIHKRYDLQDALFLSNGRELICIDSVHEVKTMEEPDYSYRYTFIRLDQIQHIGFVEEPMLDGVQNLVIRADECSVGFKVGRDFDSTYLRRYLKV